MNLELSLDTPAEADRPFTVTEVVEGARLLVQQMPTVWVEGEVSGFKAWSGGQWYFTLKDRASAMSCVVWRDDARAMKAEPEDGMKVFARGHFTVFTKRGQLQFTVRQFLPTSEGGFHALLLERARRALEKDGLLDLERKRALPPFPRRIGVVTSPEGAAWGDIVSVVTRRWPGCELVLIGARVQGREAPRELVRALRLADRLAGLDVLIVGRGGGSKEDLVAFNDEQVARAVAASRVPTISAVGHEMDTTLTDLVADVRAPTPSAAAEKAVPDRIALLRMLDGMGAQLSQAIGGRRAAVAARLAGLGRRLDASVARRIQGVGHRLSTAAMRMDSSCDARIARGRALAERLGAALDALSPLKVLDRGFAVARDADGRVLRRMEDFPAGRAFRLRVTDGEVNARSEAGS
jgi:exodeoxyribonuclease VII large subunit